MEKNAVAKEILSWIKPIIFAVVIVFVCRQFLFTPITVSGQSMEPTFHDKNKVIVSKISKIKRFDTIVFQSNLVDSKYIIKRVIGLPGDTIEMKNDVLYINGKEYKEPYLQEKKDELEPGKKLTDDFTLSERTGKTKVPEGSLFVLGDNRQNSNDSRYFGFVKDEAVLGEVKLRFFPFDEIGFPK
ncbi:signal peptidase I [Bacillus massiliigorillae]|uniref:signal peptidase I n=1 Tax=Bacillus massiliigorillae TaxID=1243664 RepID=UPI0003A3F239|nr:signal peptidase I [Bacillus massiliigorillae]